jgi:hypothetical protein
MLCSSLLMQLEMGMSMSRYLPATGTAGLDRDLVSGNSRVPRPPPRMRARTERMVRSLERGRDAWPGGRESRPTEVNANRVPVAGTVPSRAFEWEVVKS